MESDSNKNEPETRLHWKLLLNGLNQKLFQTKTGLNQKLFQLVNGLNWIEPETVSIFK